MRPRCRVRVLSDYVAQFMYPDRKKTIKHFKAMGAHYLPMLPLQPFRGHWRRPDLRNHRKLVVVDGVVGFTGSQNMIADKYHKKKGIKKGLHWHELMVRLTGPTVRELDAVFVTDWYSESDELLPLDTSPVRLGANPELVDAQILPSGPSFDNDNNLKLFAAMIQNARRRISVTSPYYVPDETIQMALVTAGSRGLDVELFVSEVGDQFMVFHAQRSYYEQLLRAGVKIYLYRAPTILHAKAPQHRRRPRGDRLVQPRHPLPELAHGALGAGPRRWLHERDARGRGRLSGQEPAGRALGLAQTLASREGLRQPDAADLLAAVAVSLRPSTRPAAPSHASARVCPPHSRPRSGQ